MKYRMIALIAAAVLTCIGVELMGAYEFVRKFNTLPEITS